MTSGHRPGDGPGGADPGGVLPEPFPWISKNDPVGRFKVTLKSPASEAVTGTLLLLAGIVFALMLFARAAVGTTVLGVLLLAVFGGLGVLLLVMASARVKWVRSYRQAYGRPPF